MDFDKRKFGVYDYYSYPDVDEVIISFATEEDIEHDGENFVGRGGNESFEYRVYDELYDAIRNCNRFAPYIEYDREVIKQYWDLITNITNILLADQKYRQVYDKCKYDKEFLPQDIICSDDKDKKEKSKNPKMNDRALFVIDDYNCDLIYAIIFTDQDTCKEAKEYYENNKEDKFDGLPYKDKLTKLVSIFGGDILDLSAFINSDGEDDESNQIIYF